MRSMAEAGMTFRSTAETPPRTPAGPVRRPLTSTRVRLAPRPRSDTVSEPGPPSVTKALEMAEVICGEPEAMVEVCSRPDADEMPFSLPCSALITWIGSGLLNSLRLMREPVTTRASTSVASDLGCSSVVFSGAAACANAAAGARTLAASPAMTVEARRYLR